MLWRFEVHLRPRECLRASVNDTAAGADLPGNGIGPRLSPPASISCPPDINIRGDQKPVQVNNVPRKETLMNRVRSLLLGASMAALAASAFAADGPTVLLPPDSTAAFKLSGAAGESARISNAPVTGQPFKTVLRVEVTKKPERSTDIQISTPIEAALAA